LLAKPSWKSTARRCVCVGGGAFFYIQQL
jgi:hypothetical protein